MPSRGQALVLTQADGQNGAAGGRAAERLVLRRCRPRPWLNRVVGRSAVGHDRAVGLLPARRSPRPSPAERGPQAMTLAPQTRLGPYEVLPKLGEGGVGEVYRARDARLGRDVALEVLPERLVQDPQAVARFQREGRALAALSHPNIRAIYDVGTEGGRAYAVMEFLEGQTLGSRLKQSRLGWREALEIALAVAEGLAAAHARGVIHRDVKPENIFLTPDGGVKILDFGLARVGAQEPTPALPTETTASLQTQPGVILGTISYMAPEQVRGQPADARTDLFALG